MDLEVKRNDSGGVVVDSPDYTLVLSEDDAVVLGKALLAVAVSSPPRVLVRTETKNRGARSFPEVR